MTNQEQLVIMKQGVDVWNRWRAQNVNALVNLNGTDLRNINLKEANLAKVTLKNTDLRGANLEGADLSGSFLIKSDLRSVNLRLANLTDATLKEADLRGVKIEQTNFSGVRCHKADLRGTVFATNNLKGTKFFKTDLRGADFRNAVLPKISFFGADLRGANFVNVNLTEANLKGANLDEANLSKANLINADLSGASLIGTIVDKTNLSGCKVYGINVWDLKGKPKEQKDIIITPDEAPIITVDNIKVAQFIYLVLNNEEIRGVINTLTSKSVLILGRFADLKRKAILNALRNELRAYNLLPIVFDFDRPVDRNITETIKTLAGISYFVIADVTSPKSSPLELQAIVPDYQIPVIPIIQHGQLPFSMISDLRGQHYGLLDPLTYDTQEKLIRALKPAIIDRAIKKHNELRRIKAKKPKIKTVDDFLDKAME